MPYLPTSQDFLEQSSQLLKAYPDTTRITTKYTYPRTSSSSTNPNRISKRTAKSKPTSTPTETTPSATTASTQQPATLTLKTFNPSSGICLKYRTNKAAEVGRLIVGLGRLASGEGGFEESSTAAVGTGGDVEMGNAPAAATPVGEAGGAGSGVDGGGKGGGGGAGGGGGGKKKKSGKGKR